MLQAQEIEQRFATIERSIDQLKQVVQSQQNVPPDLQQCVQQLDTEKSQARQVLQSKDEQRIVQCVDNLEQISDRAGQACKNAGEVDEEIRRAVQEAHRELSSLKHQLH